MRYKFKHLPSLKRPYIKQNFNPEAPTRRKIHKYANTILDKSCGILYNKNNEVNHD